MRRGESAHGALVEARKRDQPSPAAALFTTSSLKQVSRDFRMGPQRRLKCAEAPLAAGAQFDNDRSPLATESTGLVNAARESMSHELELFVGNRAILERLRTRWPDVQ